MISDRPNGAAAPSYRSRRELPNGATLKLILPLLISTASPGYGAWISDDLRLPLAQSVEVRISDDVRDGCWTNSGEVKQYAEDQLRISGFNVVDTGGEALVFFIFVSGFMPKSTELCVVSLRLELNGVGDIDGMIALASIYQYSALLTGPPNLNREILNSIRDQIADLSR